MNPCRLFSGLLLWTLALAARASPQRIASLNICIDQLLWELVPRARLVSFSYLTGDPMWSAIAAQIQGPVARGELQLNHGLAEEIAPLQPDLVLAGEYDSPDAVGLLQRLGLRVERLPLPQRLDDIAGQVSQLADLAGESARGQQMAAHINQQIDQLRQLPKPAQSPSAYWYSSNGVVIGAGTLENELMQLAGMRNLAAEQGINGFSQLNLELLLTAKPDLLILEESNSGAYSLAREYLAHPALAQAQLQIIRLPAGLSGCAASVVGDVAQAMRDQLSHPVTSPQTSKQ